jgi:hypothetical protein
MPKNVNKILCILTCNVHHFVYVLRFFFVITFFILIIYNISQDVSFLII